MRPIVVPLAAATLLIGAAVPVAAAGTTPPATPAPAGPTSPPDPLAEQLRAALAQQAELAATKGALAADVEAAKAAQGTLAALVRGNQQAIQSTLQQLALAEQAFHDATGRQTAAHAAGMVARDRERQDREMLILYVRQRYLDQDSFVPYVLSSISLSDLIDRQLAVGRLVGRGESLVLQMREDSAAAAGAEQAAALDGEAASAAAGRLSSQQDLLEGQTRHAGNLIGQLGRQARAGTAEITAANAQDVALAQRITELRIEELDQTIAAANDADWQAASYYVQAKLGALFPGGATGAPGVAGAPYLTWPVSHAVITQGFGPSSYPFEPPARGFMHFHTGIDLAGPLGTPVLAAADGTVVATAASSVGYGQHIIVAHGASTLTLYGHLESMLVNVGDPVHAGQPIGLLGSTGNSTGPHCHFEVRVGGVAVDPGPLLTPPAAVTGPQP